jgi:K+-sensing histidine kinase KdpD
VALDQIIQDVIFLIRQHAKDRQINVMFKNQLLKGFNQIRGNSSQLKYVLLTLFNKSFEGLENGGKLNALIKNSSNEIEIFISIVGAGRPEKEESRQAARYSTPIDETDISFSIGYNVIRRHQGTIQIDYPKGGGHVFNIKFPIFIN